VRALVNASELVANIAIWANTTVPFFGSASVYTNDEKDGNCKDNYEFTPTAVDVASVTGFVS
jgi:hypothetical protein